jgi:hypothetical protein
MELTYAKKQNSDFIGILSKDRLKLGFTIDKRCILLRQCSQTNDLRAEVRFSFIPIYRVLLSPDKLSAVFLCLDWKVSKNNEMSCDVR